MTSHLDNFRKDYLNANTWSQRKDGVPLDLLDKLSKEELAIAETELIGALNSGDDWPIIGLGYIKSEKSLPVLYDLLSPRTGSLKVIIAHAIYKICSDESMIAIALEETVKVSSEYELVDLLHLLPDFEDERVRAMLDGYRDHENYFVAYKATRVLGLPTESVVERFRDKEI